MTDIDLGKRLEGLRVKRHLSQGQLAEKTGVSRALISKIETGDRRLTAEIAEKLAPVLGVTVAHLRGLASEEANGNQKVDVMHVNLSTIGELDPGELARLEEYIQFLADKLIQRRREDGETERRRKTTEET